MKTTKYLLIAPLAASLFFTSCGGDKSENGDDVAASDSLAIEATSDLASETFFQVPSPGEMLTFIKMICGYFWNSIVYVLSLFKILFPWTLLIIIPLIILFVYGCIRLLYPFWSWQPVYHKYDIWRFFQSDPYIIHETIPTVNKYYNPRSILTSPFLNTNEDEQRKMISFLQSNYTVSENVIYIMSLSYLQTLLSGHSKQIMVSIQRSPEKLPFVDIWLGLMISYPVQMVYNKASITANYWHTICTDKFVKQKHPTRELIQTHERKCRNAMVDVKASLFLCN
jgi:hypothetical protein